MESLLARLSKPTPFDRVVGRPRSPIFVAMLRTSIKRWVSVLLSAGWNKENLRSLADMASPKAVEAILTDQYERVGHGHWPPGSSTVASNLLLVIRTRQGLTEEQIKPSIEFCRAVKAPRPTMTSKNRDRLAVYDDPEIFERFLKLPGLCWKAADKQFVEGRLVTAARLHLFATAIAILQCKPLRRSSLALLDIKKHFRYDKNGYPKGFCIDGRETKTGHDAEAIFPPQLAKRLEIHLQKYRVHQVTDKSTHLFPGRGGAAMHPQTIGNGVTKLIADYLGLDFNIHFFRHLVATITLDDDPGNGPIAQRMLDHTSLQTTVRKYGIQRTKGAQEQYAQILERRLLKGRKK